MQPFVNQIDHGAIGELWLWSLHTKLLFAKLSHQLCPDFSGGVPAFVRECGQHCQRHPQYLFPVFVKGGGYLSAIHTRGQSESSDP